MVSRFLGQGVETVKNLSVPVWVAFALLPAILLYEYLSRLLKIELYQYVPVLFLAVALLFWVDWDKQFRLPSKWPALALLLVGIAVAGLGSFLGSPWLGCVAFLCLFAAFLGSQNAGDVPGRRLWPLIIPSLLLLRAPFQMDNQLTAALQVATSAFSSFLLDSFGVIHRLAGNVFFLERGSLFVENACSGVQSLFSLLFVASLMLVGLKRPLILLPLYLLTAAAWALVMNVVRVTTIALAQEWYDYDLAHGWRHEVLGYFCLIIAIGLMFSSDRLFQILFYAVPENEQANKSVNPLILLWNRLTQLAPMKEQSRAGSLENKGIGLVQRFQIPILATVAVMAVATNVLAYRSLDSVRTMTDTEVWIPPEDLLADVSDDLRVHSQTSATRSQESALGKYSVLWNCEIDGFPMRIAVSQYDEYHDLCNCYGANGWTIKDRELISSSVDRGWRFITASFVNSENTVGTLLFSSMTRDGLPIDAKELGFWSGLKSRFGSTDDRSSARFDSESMNIQFWITSERPFNSQQLDKLKKVHELVRRKIQLNVRSSAG